ncbi:MAG: Maf family protein, partial [Candidatus Neomarinimicrobiota bacterium]
MKLVLASGSPRRRELLARLGIPFETVPSGHAEGGGDLENPIATCRRLAEEKARKVAQDMPEALVLGADTVVVLDGQPMGKPADVAEARRMLTALSGRTHQVLTAMALLALQRGHRSGFVETTEVTFHPLESVDIEHYLAHDPPLDKAGAYGIQ